MKPKFKYLNIYVFIFLSFFIQKNILTFVQVDTSLKLSSDEQSYNQKRKPYIKNGVAKFLNDPSILNKKYLPRIDFCFSGGGYRAMIADLGFMVGAQKIDLINIASSIAAVSGGTWFLIPWIMHQQTPSQYLPNLRKKVNGFKLLDPLKTNWKVILQKLRTEYQTTGYIKVVDFYGALIASDLFSDFGKDAQYITFEDLKKILIPNYSYYPFPICTSTIDNQFTYGCLEVNPFYTGSDDLGGYIPTFAFNNPFCGGWSVNNIFFQESLGTYLGLFGSAYSLSFWDIIKQIIMALAKPENKQINLSLNKKKELKWFIEAFIKPFYEKRILASHFNNFTYRMSGLPLCNKTHLTLSDGGMFCNFAITPLLKRGSDIIIMCDSDLEVPYHKTNELTWASKYAKKHGYKFPDITKPKKISEYIYLFEDSDADTPTLIYFENPIKDSTLKFNYSEDQFNVLYSRMAYMVTDHKSAIQDAIKRKINKINSLKYRAKEKIKDILYG